MTRDRVEKELRETATLVLAAMAAEERVHQLDPRASMEQAAEVLDVAGDLRARAMARFKTMCARLAVSLK